jgi:hypothetical protein
VQGGKGLVKTSFIISLTVAGAVIAACFIDNPALKLAPERDAEAVAKPDGALPLVDAGPSICARYGGYAAAEKITNAAVAAVVSDCRIGRFFAGLDAKKSAHLVDCLTKQVAVVLGCEGVRYDVDNAGERCLGMQESHRTLSIRNQDMDVFVEDLVTVLQSAGVAQTDIDAIAPGILSLRGDIVTNSAPGNGKSICDAGPSVPDGSLPADAGGGG